MAQTVNSPIPDKWFALSQLGKVVKEASAQDLIVSDDAFYYVRKKYHMYNKYLNGALFKYLLFDASFTPTFLRWNGIVGTTDEFNEGVDRHDNNRRRLNFNLIDKGGNSTVNYRPGGIEAFQEIITYMDLLGNYESKKVLDLTQEINSLQVENQVLIKEKTELEAKNTELLTKLSDILDSKNDLRKLTELLYSN